VFDMGFARNKHTTCSPFIEMIRKFMVKIRVDVHFMDSDEQYRC
jgi:hypothetical protein